MVPMMLPAVLPMLSRYRRSMCGAEGMHLHGLTAVVGGGYFVVWAVIGAAVAAAGAAIMAAEMRWVTLVQWMPVGSGVMLLVAGGMQLSTWKARQLALCREETGCGVPSVPDALGAWRHGLSLGVRCSLCCGSLMLALLAAGMDPVAMAAVTLAISAERLARAPVRVARVGGMAIVQVGLLTIARFYLS